VSSRLPNLATVAFMTAIAASALCSLSCPGTVRSPTGSTVAGSEVQAIVGQGMQGSEPRAASSAWEVIANVTVGVRPTAVVTNYDETDLLVSNSGSDNVSVVSTINHTVVHSISVGSDPVAIAEGPLVGVNNATEEFYVANENSSNLTIIDNMSVAGSIAVGQGPDGIAYDWSSGLLYVANLESDNVSVVNGTRVVASIPVGLAPVGVAWNPANGYIYVANSGSNNVSVLNGTAVIGSIPVGVDPTAVWYYRWFGDVEVSDTGSNNVSWISGLSLRTSFPVGVGPAGGVYLQGISADAGEGPVFVTNSGSNNVSVLNGTVQLQSVPVRSDPTGITTTEASYYVYVTDTGSDDVSVLAQLVPEPKYQVQFDEVGLTPMTNWSVALNGTTERSNTSEIQFEEPNGSYSFSVGPLWIYLEVPSSGTIEVNGSSVSKTIVFSSPCFGGSGCLGRYSVEFTETGLPSGTTWSFMINGSTISGSTASLTFSLQNGTYPFTVGEVAGYSVNPQSGSVTVNGSGVVREITFTPITTSKAPGTTSTFWGLSDVDWYVLVGAMVAVALIGSVVAVARHRRGKAPPDAGSSVRPD
jgi:YVTN family beta-propeller protein